MSRLFRVLIVLTVVGLNLLWLVPAGVLSGTENIGPYEVVDDYWPLERNGGGRLVYEVHGTGSIWYGTGSSTGAIAAVDDTAIGNLNWGDEVDRSWTCFWNQGYGVWDLGVEYSEVVLFPFIDHTNYSHAFTYAVYGSNDFSASKPGAATWISARLDKLYVKGWSGAGEDQYEVCNDDWVTTWSWPSSLGGGSAYRFVRVHALPDSGRTTKAFDAEVDAVKGVLPITAEAACGVWETAVVDKGRTFSYTSLEVGDDDRVHVAYGGDQLYYAVLDGSTWNVEEVDTGGKGAYCSLVLDDNGYPAISYYDAVNGDLKFAYKNGDLNDVWGTSSSDIYAVGEGGTVLYYDGVAWTPMASHTVETLYGIWGSGGNWGGGDRVYAVGGGGTMLRYSGSGWSQMTVPPSTPALYGVWGNSATDVFAVGANGTVLYYDGVSWTAVASGTTQALRGVWGTSGSNVLAVGDLGTIVHYDGVDDNLDGSLWDPMTSGTSYQLSAVWGDSASNVYVVGNNGVMRRYDGSYWNTVSSSVTDCLSDIWGTSASDIFAVGCRGTVIHFAGSSWSRMISDTTKRLYGVWGSSGTSVVAVGDDGAITGYDGTIWMEMAEGDGWLTQTVDSTNDVGKHTSLAFINGNPAISYYDTTNANLKYAVWSPWSGTWVRQTVDSQDWVGEYTSLAFSGGNPAISYYDATNEDLKLAYWDGECWEFERIDTSGDVGRYSSLAFDMSGNAAISYHDATAGSLKFAKWKGGSWDVETVDDQEWVGQYTSLGFDAANQPGISYYDALNQDLKYAHWVGIGWDVAVVDEDESVGSHSSVGFDSFGGVVVSYYDATDDGVKVAYRDNDAPLSGVWGNGASTILAVGGYGTIRRYSGQAWPPVAPGTSVRLNGIWGASSTDIYAVGDGGTILHYDGSTWMPMSTGGSMASLLGVWGRSASEIYAVGEGGVILRYNGSAWIPMSSGTTRSLAGVWGAPSSSDVFAVGEYGTILRYNGSTWSTMSSPTTQWLGGVWGESSSSVFAVGDGGTILYFNGTKWAPKKAGTNTTMALRGVWGTSYSNVLTVGEQGTILRFDGAKWNAMTSGTAEWLRGVWGSSSSNVFAVGDGGTILKYDGASWSVVSTGEWAAETVDPYPWAGRFSSLAFDPDNNPAVSFYDGREGDLKYAHWMKDHWSVETVDWYGDVGRYTSLAFDESGNPCISYYDASQGDLKYASWNGSGWDVSRVDRAGDVGSYSSLGFDNLGNAGISYYDATNGRLKYAHWNGTGWELARPDPTDDDVGRYSSLAFDSAGNAGIGYYDLTSRELRFAQQGVSGWGIAIVDRVGDWVEGEHISGYCSVQFDCLANPAVSYYDATDGNLKYAHWSGTDWELQVVESEGQVGMYTSLAFDDSKYPAISYHDGTKGALKLARWNGEIWSLETIDDLQAAGHLTSLAFDRCGVPAISYDSAITGDLKYASPANPKPEQPVNKSPAEGKTYVSLTPTLECEAFADPCGDPHRASQWMITSENCDVNCGPVFDSGIDETNLLEIEVPAGLLEPLTTYYWCVRHQDCRGAWSKYSEKTIFTTASPPEQPVNVSPGDGATSVGVTPVFEASAFVDPEYGDRHIASQWQITMQSDNYSDPLFEQTVERVNLTRIDIPDDTLANRTTYYWRVRYQDNHGSWSEFSVETSFTTNSAPETPVNQRPEDGVRKAGLTPMLEASAFTDGDADETHLASQWRVTKHVDDEVVVVYESGEDSANLTAIEIPDETLEHDGTYYWQVRYQDSQGSWSSWSAETGFSTGGPPAVPAALLVAAAAVAVVAVVAMTAPLVVPL